MKMDDQSKLKFMAQMGAAINKTIDNYFKNWAVKTKLFNMNEKTVTRVIARCNKLMVNSIGGSFDTWRREAAQLTRERKKMQAAMNKIFSCIESNSESCFLKWKLEYFIMIYNVDLHAAV